jgi:hypothetical protein
VGPLGFLDLLFETTRREAKRIGGLTDGQVGDEVREDADEVFESLVAHLDRTIDELHRSDPDTFEVLSTTLTTNYAEDIDRIRQLRADHGDDLPDAVTTALDDLADDLKRIDVARQCFKSIYLQEERSSLSRVLPCAGISAEIAAVTAPLALTAQSGIVVIGTDYLFVPAAIVVSFVPLALLLAFIVRTATVTERTAAMTPVTTPC